jgi:hypothetical protein
MRSVVLMLFPLMFATPADTMAAEPAASMTFYECMMPFPLVRFEHNLAAGVLERAFDWGALPLLGRDESRPLRFAKIDFPGAAGSISYTNSNGETVSGEFSRGSLAASNGEAGVMVLRSRPGFIGAPRNIQSLFELGSIAFIQGDYGVILSSDRRFFSGCLKNGISEYSSVVGFSEFLRDFFSEKSVPVFMCEPLMRGI